MTSSHLISSSRRLKEPPSSASLNRLFSLSFLVARFRALPVPRTALTADEKEWMKGSAPFRPPHPSHLQSCVASLREQLAHPI